MKVKVSFLYENFLCSKVFSIKVIVQLPPVGFPAFYELTMKNKKKKEEKKNDRRKHRAKIGMKISHKRMETFESNEKEHHRKKCQCFARNAEFFFDLIGHSTTLPLNSSNRGKCVPF